ncbi:MAG: endonuclease domain-containing protein [Candidatus Portnoybacteria bacterium]|nr:endonuclease domain-containing protein [Candidatus Portnoybacteria bacterium]MDD4982628.1 endonuclease domain-containing protein [Candidatus Portnoybacteria bacterium]
MFTQTRKFISYDAGLKDRARNLRNHMTAAERKLWFGCLRGHKYRFIRQKIVSRYILDFYCQKLKLAIETDGDSHIGDRNEEYDKNRTAALNKLGIEVIRFWNTDILNNLNEVAEIIERKIKQRI